MAANWTCCGWLLAAALLASFCTGYAQVNTAAQSVTAQTQLVHQSIASLETRFKQAEAEASRAEDELNQLRAENTQLRASRPGQAPQYAGGSAYASPGQAGQGPSKAVKFFVFVLLIAVLLGGIGHAKQNKLGPFAANANNKKSDGELGGGWGDDSGGGYDPSAEFYGTGNGGGGGASAGLSGYAQQSFNIAPQVSAYPDNGGMGGGSAFMPPGPAEARAALSRRGR